MTRQDIPTSDVQQPEGCFLPLWKAAELLAKGHASAQDLVNWCEAAYTTSHHEINAIILADFPQRPRRGQGQRRAPPPWGAASAIWTASPSPSRSPST
ncbi:hypothetical protein ACU4GD_40495 [Cupriavidus basilensis]